MHKTFTDSTNSYWQNGKINRRHDDLWQNAKISLSFTWNTYQKWRLWSNYLRSINCQPTKQHLPHLNPITIGNCLAETAAVLANTTEPTMCFALWDESLLISIQLSATEVSLSTDQSSGMGFQLLSATLICQGNDSIENWRHSASTELICTISCARSSLRL